MSERARILVDPKVQWSIDRRIVMHWMFLVWIASNSPLVHLLSAIGQQPADKPFSIGFDRADSHRAG